MTEPANQGLLSHKPDPVKIPDDPKELNCCLVKSAADGNIEEMKKFISAGADINWTDEDHYTHMGFISCVGPGVTPLGAACGGNKPAAVALLLDLGADPNIVNKKGQGALYWIAQTTTVSPDFIQVVKTILEAGADLNRKDVNMNTPFSIAVEYGKAPLVGLFLQYGADVNTVGRGGRTPLFLLAGGDRQGDIVDMLIKYGADPNFKDKDGKTPLNFFCNSSNRIKWTNIGKLLDAGADANTCDDNLETPLYAISSHSAGQSSMAVKAAAELIRGGADIAAANFLGRIPLHQAAKNSNYEMMEFLIEKDRSQVNRADFGGNTPLHDAVMSFDPNIRCIELLLKSKADPNIRNASGHTPFTLASMYCTTEIILTMAAYGADINKADGNGLSPLILAAERGLTGAVTRLVKAGADVTATDRDGNNYMDILKKNFSKKYDRWIRNAIVKTRRKILDREDSYDDCGIGPDFNI